MYDDFLLLKIIRHDLHVAFSQSPYISILWVEDVGAERGGGRNYFYHISKNNVFLIFFNFHPWVLR